MPFEYWNKINWTKMPDSRVPKSQNKPISLCATGINSPGCFHTKKKKKIQLFNFRQTLWRFTMLNVHRELKRKVFRQNTSIFLKKFPSTV